MQFKIPSDILLNELADGILPDLPLVMHGSGDVNPRDVSNTTASLLSHLVASYIRDLIDAALDAHDVLTDGFGGLLPPPNYFQSIHHHDNECSNKSKKQRNTFSMDIMNNENNNWQPTVTKSNSFEKGEEYHVKVEDESLNFDKYYLGVSGVDLHQNYIRYKYSTIPYTIGTQSFIFPICHDPILYGRVKEIQTARRTFTDVLMDPVIMNCINEENIKPFNSNFMSSESKSLILERNSVKSESETDEEKVWQEGEVESLEVFWPGMDKLLPTYGADIL